MDAQEVGAVEGGPSLNADKVIEWVTHVMGVELTTTQKDLLRMEFGEPIAHDRTRHDWAAGGRKFARLMADAYREETDFREVSPSELMGRALDLEDMALREIKKLREDNDG